MKSYSIPFLNKLAKKNLIMVRIFDEQYTLDRIKYLRKNEDFAPSNCWVVYFLESRYWRYLKDCEFYILKEIKIK